MGQNHCLEDAPPFTDLHRSLYNSFRVGVFPTAKVTCDESHA